MTASRVSPTPLASGRAARGALLRRGAAGVDRHRARGRGRDPKVVCPTLSKEFPEAAHVTPEIVKIQGARRARDQQPALPAAAISSPAKSAPRSSSCTAGRRARCCPAYHYMQFYHWSYALQSVAPDPGLRRPLDQLSAAASATATRFRRAANTRARGNSEYQDVLAGAKYLQTRARRRSDAGRHLGALVRRAAGRRRRWRAIPTSSWPGWIWRACTSTATRSDTTTLAFRSSAVGSIDNWKSPVFLQHGDDDRNVDFAQTVGLVQSAPRAQRVLRARRDPGRCARVADPQPVDRAPSGRSSDLPASLRLGKTAAAGGEQSGGEVAVTRLLSAVLAGLVLASGLPAQRRPSADAGVGAGLRARDRPQAPDLEAGHRLLHARSTRPVRGCRCGRWARPRWGGRFWSPSSPTRPRSPISSAIDTIQRKLADPRLRAPSELPRLLAEGKNVILITSSIHSTEVGGFLTPLVLADRLARAETDEAREYSRQHDRDAGAVPESRRRGHRGRLVSLDARHAGRRQQPPTLYHHYTGHDNNRDWYAFTQVETRYTVDSLYTPWDPADRERHPPAGRQRGTHLHPAVHGPGRAQHRPDAHRRHQLRSAWRCAWRMIAEGKTGHRDQRVVRSVVAGAAVFAQPPRRAHPDRNRQRAARHRRSTMPFEPARHRRAGTTPG